MFLCMKHTSESQLISIMILKGQNKTKCPKFHGRKKPLYFNPPSIVKTQSQTSLLLTGHLIPPLTVLKHPGNSVPLRICQEHQISDQRKVWKTKLLFKEIRCVYWLNMVCRDTAGRDRVSRTHHSYLHLSGLCSYIFSILDHSNFCVQTLLLFQMWQSAHFLQYPHLSPTWLSLLSCFILP